MRKRLALVSLAILLMVSFCFAQEPRQPTSSLGKTTVTNIAVVGINNDGDDATINPGTPGYIEMTSCAGNVYYLYIDYDGLLRIASEEAVGHLASPATVSWGGATSGVVVGIQTD